MELRIWPLALLPFVAVRQPLFVQELTSGVVPPAGFPAQGGDCHPFEEPVPWPDSLRMIDVALGLAPGDNHSLPNPSEVEPCHPGSVSVPDADVDGFLLRVRRALSKLEESYVRMRTLAEAIVRDPVSAAPTAQPAYEELLRQAGEVVEHASHEGQQLLGRNAGFCLRGGQLNGVDLRAERFGLTHVTLTTADDGRELLRLLEQVWVHFVHARRGLRNAERFLAGDLPFGGLAAQEQELLQMRTLLIGALEHPPSHAALQRLVLDYTNHIFLIQLWADLAEWRHRELLGSRHPFCLETPGPEPQVLVVDFPETDFLPLAPALTNVCLIQPACAQATLGLVEQALELVSSERARLLQLRERFDVRPR